MTETRIAAYQLVEHLERLGVEVVFGLTGHTIIAMLDALGHSRVRFITARHEQVAAHAADLARANHQVTQQPLMILKVAHDPDSAVNEEENAWFGGRLLRRHDIQFYGLSILKTIIKYLLFRWGMVRYRQFN